MTCKEKPEVCSTGLTVAPEYAAYVACGFPGDIDRGIAEVGVAGIDRLQTQAMVRLCAATASYLYEGRYSPRAIRYEAGARPALEAIVRPWLNLAPEARVRAAMAWTATHVLHPHLAGMVAPDRAFTEEELIESGVGWCNEQTRVFIALCGVMEFPARLCFLNHDNARCGHAASEVFLDGHWAFTDTTFGVMIRMGDGRWASGWDLMRARSLADAAYRTPLEQYYAAAQPWVADCPGWGIATRPDANHGGVLFGYLGIANYLIDGVSAY